MIHKGDTAIDKRLLRVDEAATLLNVSRWTIYRWVHEGRLEATKLTAGSLRIFHDSVLALVEQSRTAKTEFNKVPRNPTRRLTQPGSEMPES